MSIITSTRQKTSSHPKYDSGFALRLVLVAPLLITARIVGLLLPIEDAPSRKYEGYFGSGPTGKYYDDMTKAEHESAAAWWNS